MIDKIPDDQKVTHESCLLDNPHLKLQPLLQLLVGTRSFSIPFPQPLLAKFSEVALSCHPFGNGKGRKLISAQLKLQFTPIRHRQGLLAGSGKIRKQLGHRFALFEIKLRPVRFHFSLRIVQLSVRRNTHKDLLRDRLLLADVVNIIRCHQRSFRLLA